MQTNKAVTTKLTSFSTSLLLALLSLVGFQSNSAIAAAPKTVTFNANGGVGTIASQTDNKPGTLTLNCTAPNTCTITRAGYSFSGWNTAADGSGMAYADGASYSFAADLTLYAQWTLNPVSHTVTFNSNGGSGAMSIQSSSSSTTLNSNLFTRAGYTFTNWNTASNGSGTAYADGATYSFSADLTLYAQWTAIPSHTVIFDANGGSGSMVNQTNNVATALSPNNFTRSGYSFLHWNTAADGSGTTYADGATYSFASNLTLYAQWTALPTFTVVFDSNGGVGTMFNQVDHGPANLNLNTFTNDGYSFVEWNEAADGSGKKYADGANYPFNADVTLYAQWSALPTHTVTFDANGGSGSMSVQSANVATSLTANAFTRVGYVFAGWNTAADGSGTAYADGAIYSFGADLTLYAKWTALPTFTVTFDANGGSGTMAAQVASASTALSAAAFTRTGYTFTGWNTAANGSGTAYADGATYSFAADLMLYAQWIPSGADLTVNIPAITGLSNPVTGYLIYSTVSENSQFSGSVSWSNNPVVFAPLTVYTATITLTAKPGYTFTGVPANFFTVSGASTATNAADSGVITATFLATGPVISTDTNLNTGQSNPVIVIKGSGFKSGDLTSDFIINTNDSGLTVSSIVGNNPNQVTINFTGTVTAGYVTVQAKTSAFNPAVSSPSNIVFLIFAESTSTGGSTVPISISLGGSTIDIIVTLPTALKTGQNVSLSMIAANDSAANYPVLTLDITSNYSNFDKPIVITMPNLTSVAKLAHSASPEYQLIPLMTQVPGEDFCGNPDNDGYIDNGATVTIYTCHISSYGYRQEQAALSMTAAASSITVGGTTQLNPTGGSGTVAYTYSTTTSSVCSVSSTGLVTAISAGTCLVTVSNPASGTYIDKTSSAVSITVNAASSGGGGGGGGGTSSGGSGGITVTYLSQPSVSIASAESTIQLTKTTKLTITGGAGSGVVTYSTTTPDTCSVTSDGVVTGLKAGTCNVRATKAASGTYLEANTPYITVTVSDSEKKAADEAAAKAAADAAAAALANDEAAAAAAAKAEADRLALLAAEAAKAEAARLLILNKNQITWKKSGKIYKVNVNMAQRYAWEFITIKVGSKLKGKVVYKTADWLALNGSGDGVITQRKAPVKGSYYRIVLGKKVIYTQLIK